jgi:hypothetical protein
MKEIDIATSNSTSHGHCAGLAVAMSSFNSLANAPNGGQPVLAHAASARSAAHIGCDSINPCNPLNLLVPLA